MNNLPQHATIATAMQRKLNIAIHQHRSYGMRVDHGIIKTSDRLFYPEK